MLNRGHKKMPGRSRAFNLSFRDCLYVVSAFDVDGSYPVAFGLREFPPDNVEDLLIAFLRNRRTRCGREEVLTVKTYVDFVVAVHNLLREAESPLNGGNLRFDRYSDSPLRST